MNWSFITLSTNIKLDDLKKLFLRTVLNETQQNQLISVFNTLAGDDNEISLEEWNTFQSEIDKNSDKNITKEELYKTINTKFKNIRSLTGDQLKIFYNLIHNFINKPIDRNKEVYADETCLSVNENRGLKNKRHYNSKTNGSFTKNWLLSDKYNSQTYEDWLKNNKFTYNEQVGKEMAQTIHKKIKNKKTKSGYCAKAVYDTIQPMIYSKMKLSPSCNENDDYNVVETTEKLSLMSSYDRQSWALQTSSVLAENPNFKELPHNIVVSMDLTQLPVGSIVVYDAGYKNNATHPYGHIDIVDENGKGCSDQIRDLATEKQNTHIRVFIPIIA